MENQKITTKGNNLEGLADQVKEANENKEKIKEAADLAKDINEGANTESKISLREQKMQNYKDLGFDYEAELAHAKDALEQAKASGDTSEIDSANSLLADLSNNPEAYFRQSLLEEGIAVDSPKYQEKLKAFNDINFDYANQLAQQKIQAKETLLRKENEKLAGKNKIETIKNHLTGNKDTKRTIAELEESIRLENKKISKNENARFEYSIRNKNGIEKLFARGGDKMMKLKDHFTTPEKKKQLFKRLKRSALLGAGAGLLTIGTGGAIGLVAGAGLAVTRSFGGFVGAEAAQGVLGATQKDSRIDLAKLKEQRKNNEVTVEEYNKKRDALLEGRGKKLRNRNKLKNAVIGASTLAGSLSAGGFVEMSKGEDFLNPFKRFGNMPGRLINGVQNWFAGSAEVIPSSAAEHITKPTLETGEFSDPIETPSEEPAKEVDSETMHGARLPVETISPLSPEGIKSQDLNLYTEDLAKEIPDVDSAAELDTKAETISGDIFINKGEGITHAFLRQLNADTEMGEKLRIKMNIDSGPGSATGEDAFRAAKQLGYIGENDEVRVNFGKGAGYELKIDDNGKLISNEYFGGYVDTEGNYVGDTIVKHETHASGDRFEGRGIEDRSTKQNYEYRKPRGSYETNQPERVEIKRAASFIENTGQPEYVPINREQVLAGDQIIRRAPAEVFQEQPKTPVQRPQTIFQEEPDIVTQEFPNEPIQEQSGDTLSERDRNKIERKRLRQERRLARIKSGKAGFWEKAVTFLAGTGVGYVARDIIEDGRVGSSSGGNPRIVTAPTPTTPPAGPTPGNTPAGPSGGSTPMGN